MAWLETGGANTNPLTVNNWLGTINAAPLIIRTEGAEVMRVTPADPAVLPGLTRPRGVGIGTTEPRAKLHVEESDPSFTGPSIHAGGSSAALSFASQAFQNFDSDGRNGKRWEWLATSDGDGTSSARLWSTQTKLFVTSKGQVLLPGGLLPSGSEGNVVFPDVPIGVLPSYPTSPPIWGELVLGGVRTSLRGFDGPLQDPTVPEGFGMRLGYHWIRTNGNENEPWMAFKRFRGFGGGLGRLVETAVQWFGPRFNDTSDERLKTNVRQVEGALDKLVQIRGVAFDWAEAESPYALGGVPGEPGLGAVAQTVEEVFPDVVSTYGPDQEYKAVDYSGLTSVVIEAVKELKAENEALRSRIEALERTQQ
jgi:hypothetical protein